MNHQKTSTRSVLSEEHAQFIFYLKQRKDSYESYLGTVCVWFNVMPWKRSVVVSVQTLNFTDGCVCLHIIDGSCNDVMVTHDQPMQNYMVLEVGWLNILCASRLCGTFLEKKMPGDISFSAQQRPVYRQGRYRSFSHSTTQQSATVKPRA